MEHTGSYTRKGGLRRGLAAALAAAAWVTLMGGSVVFPSCSARADATAAGETATVSGTGYTAYCAQYGSAAKAQEPVAIDLSAVRGGCEDETAAFAYPGATEWNGEKTLDTADQGYVEWDVAVPQDGLYQIEMTYYPTKGKGASIVRRLTLDGVLPFDECRNLTFSRVFGDAEAIATDEKGNQVRPMQVEIPEWRTVRFRDEQGYHAAPLLFFFSQGRHTLRLEAVREPLTIASLRLVPEQTVAEYTAPQPEGSGQRIRIEGEAAEARSDSQIYPLCDRSTPATYPSDAAHVRLNTIGGTKWQSAGQWIRWRFYVEETGSYKLGIKFRQNTVAGQASYRRLLIDGVQPYRQVGQLRFPYDTAWQQLTVGDGGKPYLFRLEKGWHTLQLEVVLGELAPLVQQVDDLISQVNEIYRDLRMVLGQDADQSRDYNLAETMPEQIAQLGDVSRQLATLYDDYVALSRTNGYQAQILHSFQQLTGEMAAHPDKIAARFSSFSDEISSLGTWLTTARQQPLQIDYIEVVTADEMFSAPSVGFFPYLGYLLRQFAYSFVTDYNAGTATDQTRSVRVWMTSGRDQANALSQLAKNSFSPKTGIEADIQLVAAGTLLTATLANKGPDVALSQPSSDPMNYAMRGAVQDLAGFSDFPEIAQRFQKSALEPLSFDGKVYGLPETQSFYMMFYRKDILEELGLAVPQTWDDVIAMLPVLQKKNLNFGLPVPYSVAATGVGLPMYATLLYQLGGSFYTGDGTASALDSTAAAEAFSQWLSFYTDYDLPTQYDLNNRFRSGLIPIAIADYGSYNALSVFAPELDGVWAFAPIPGVRQKDGSIDHTVASSVTSTVIMSACRDTEAAWEFLKWWTGADIQTAYGQELESIMGTAARYQTANIESLYSIPWSSSDHRILLQQWQQTRGIPELPGSYMTSRYVDFAFKQVLLNGAEDPNKCLLNAAKLINAEITTKRDEFGLS